MIVTQSDYAELVEQNEKLESENNTYISDLDEANKKINELQSQTNQELENIKQQYDNEIQKKYDVDFQNISLILNGINTNYSDKVAIINNQTYYSMGFLQYLVDSKNISENNEKLFIGDIQSEEQMPISLFELNPFTEGYSLCKTTNESDNFDNIFSEAFRVRSGNWSYNDLMNNATEYYIDRNYTSFCFDYAYAKNANQDFEYEILIYGDDNLLESIILNRKTKPDSKKINISNIEYLKIVGKSEAAWGYDGCYSLMINPYLYP